MRVRALTVALAANVAGERSLALSRPPRMVTDPVLPTPVRQLRCAIYTRKSTDEGLDQEFNSLDAQREAAEAFILSQRGEGLVAIPERYDDGGFSGGSLDRPALERLLAEIRRGAVECVVVYKVDRLSRSLIDFARIIDIFERHNVSFVSVTQQFNTTNSLGRLTLNILLSFAQFEREIIAERTRDKLSAARRKGKWIGGRPVLGYDIDPRCSRLNVNADEAFHVRAMFRLYLEHCALAPVAREANRRGWRTKQWITRKGIPQGGKRFTKGRIFRLLRNPIYCGKVRFRNQLYDGQHEAIIDVQKWERVQQILTSNRHNGGPEVRNRADVVPKGLLRCACCGEEMIPTRYVKGTPHRRDYVCAQARQPGRGRRGTVRVSESAAMSAIIEVVRRLVSDPRIAARVLVHTEDLIGTTMQNLTFERDVALRVLAGLRVNLPADHQEQMSCIERRLEEIGRELQSLTCKALSDGVRVSLVEFQSLWNSLKGHERARIISGLIDRAIYNSTTDVLLIDVRTLGGPGTPFR